MQIDQSMVSIFIDASGGAAKIQNSIQQSFINIDLDSTNSAANNNNLAANNNSGGNNVNIEQSAINIDIWLIYHLYNSLINQFFYLLS